VINTLVFSVIESFTKKYKWLQLWICGYLQNCSRDWKGPRDPRGFGSVRYVRFSKRKNLKNDPRWPPGPFQSLATFCKNSFDLFTFNLSTPSHDTITIVRSNQISKIVQLFHAWWVGRCSIEKFAFLGNRVWISLTPSRSHTNGFVDGSRIKLKLDTIIN
jgi:hypothetical protein